MKCDFKYCIYNENYMCILNEPQINAFGICEECILVSISDIELTALKKEQLKHLEK